jgi:hypothetical protein
MRHLLPAIRILFGAWLLGAGTNHFFLLIWPVPEGSEPLGIQLIGALAHSGLLDIAMGILLAAGALILVGLLVPFALCMAMPVIVGAAYWAVLLERDPVSAVLALAALALNALLMLAYLDHYRGALQVRAMAMGESDAAGESYERTYSLPLTGISPVQFSTALVPSLGAAAFYHFMVPSLLALYCLLVLVVPAALLLVRGVRGMKRSS